MKAKLQAVGIAVFLIFCFFSVQYVRTLVERSKDMARIEAELDAADKRLATLDSLKAQFDSAMAVDTVKVQVAVTKYKTVRDTVLMLDSLGIPDTAAYIATTRRALLKADSALASYDSLKRTTDNALWVRDSIISQLRIKDSLKTPQLPTAPRFVRRGEVLYEPYNKVITGRLGVDARITKTWSVRAEAEHRFEGPGESRLRVGAVKTF